MKKNKKKLLVILLLLLIGVSASYVAGTYAKYTDSLSDVSGTATVAKWAFKAENEGKNTELSLDLDGTYYTSSLYQETSDKWRIAPGTKGSFAIKLSNEMSEVGVKYTIDFTDVTNVPTNLKFYTDAAYTSEVDPSTQEVVGYLKQGETEQEVKIYWQWVYEPTEGSDANDAADTQDGYEAGDMTIKASITGVQTKPTEDVTTGYTVQTKA